MRISSTKRQGKSPKGTKFCNFKYKKIAQIKKEFNFFEILLSEHNNQY